VSVLAGQVQRGEALLVGQAELRVAAVAQGGHAPAPALPRRRVQGRAAVLQKTHITSIFRYIDK